MALSDLPVDGKYPLHLFGIDLVGSYKILFVFAHMSRDPLKESSASIRCIAKQLDACVIHSQL